MVGYRVSTFILPLHLAGGFLFSTSSMAKPSVLLVENKNTLV